MLSFKDLKVCSTPHYYTTLIFLVRDGIQFLNIDGSLKISNGVSGPSTDHGVPVVAYSEIFNRIDGGIVCTTTVVCVCLWWQHFLYYLYSIFPVISNILAFINRFNWLYFFMIKDVITPVY